MSAITLFDAAQQVREHVGQVDPETGELSESYTDSLDLFREKGGACVAYAIDEAGTIRAMEAALAQAQDHVRARKARLDRFHAYLSDCMAATGTNKLASTDGLFTATRYPQRDVSVEIDEGAEFPPELCNEPRPPAPSKTKIRAAIEAGEPISGARIVRKDRLGRWPGDLQMTIFGYTWDEIKRAQQGGALARRIPAVICKPLATEGDWELLERYGEAELRNRHYFGVLDRLENTRMANDMPDCDRSACRDHSLSACDNPDCPSLRPNAVYTTTDKPSPVA